MRYGAIPSNLIERLALRAGAVPTPLLDCLGSLMKARSLMAAVDLGVFEGLREGPLAAAELAARCRLDPTSTDLLLRTLVWCEYLELKGGRFRLSRLARRTMLRGAPMELTGYVRWNFTQWRIVESLEQLVRSGRGLDFHQTMSDPAEWRAYQQAMHELARFSAPWLARKVPVPAGARRLLDLGGSHGSFGAALCRRHPPLRSLVLDLPPALAAARELCVAAGNGELVEHREGDITAIEYPSDQDVVLLANVLHHLSAEAAAQVVARAFAASRRSGTIAIWELEAPPPQRAPELGHGAALYFRLTSTAEAFAVEDYQGWLGTAGYRRLKVLRPTFAPGAILVVGRKD